MALDLQGYIIDDSGKRVGGRFDPTTNKLLELPSRDRFMPGESGNLEYERAKSELGLTSRQVITSADMNPVTPPNFQTPSTPQSSFPVVDDFQPDVLGPKGTEVSDLLKSITADTTALGGQTAFRAGEEQRLGVETLQREEGDLFSLLKQQQAEFQNIQTQGQLAGARIAEEFAGRAGTTQQGLMTEAEQRKITLRGVEVAARANTTAALLAGTQGKITTALALVDKAIKQKYGALEEERKIKIDNLNLLLQDPALSLEQKNRANKQLAYQKSQQDAETKKKEDSTTIANWALTMKQNGATAQQATELMNLAMSANPDMNRAFQLYSPFSTKPTQNKFEQRLDATGNLIEYELNPQGQVVNQKIISKKSIVGGVVGDGKTGEGISDITGKPLTQEERLSQGYANRSVDAHKIIEEIGLQFTGTASYITGSKFFPNIFKSADRQRYDQAQRNFVNAILRRESGAAIAESEFQNARLQYFPQPGDKPQVIAQKARNREVVIRSLQLAGGVSTNNDPLGIR